MFFSCFCHVHACLLIDFQLVMKVNYKLLIGILVASAMLVMIGFFTAKHIYNKPLETKIEHDTVTFWDTIPHYYPKPVKVEKVKTEYKWLTRVENTTDTLLDSVLVQVPIESRHYCGEGYDAYVSGFNPTLDSIFVHQKTEYITETITRMKPPNKLSLDVTTGLSYLTNDKRLVPFLQGELTYKPSKVAFGIQGGVYEENKELKPYVAGIMKFKIL